MDLRSREEFRVGGYLGMNLQTYHGCPLGFTKEKDIMVKKKLELLLVTMYGFLSLN